MSESANKNWLLLSHAFNMDGIASSQTITDKIPHLLARGVRPVVVSAPTGRKDQVLEHHQVFSLMPSGLRYELRHWLKIHMLHSRWMKPLKNLLLLLLLPFYLLEKLLLPLDSHWSWTFSAYCRGLRLIREKKLSLIYSTGGANCAHFAGYLLARRTGLPWVAEIHDPMIHKDWQKGFFQYRQAAFAEKLVCSRADIAFWFTPTALARAGARNPQLGQRGRQVIPGANPPSHAKQPYRKGEKFALVHFGSLANNRNLRQVFQALTSLFQRHPEYADLVRLRIYGGGLDAVSEEAAAAFAWPQIIERMGRLEYDPETGLSGRERVLRAMEASDVLLLLHGEDGFCEEYYPSKLYEYFWTQRPILGLVWRNPSLEALLHEQGHTAANAENIEEIAARIGGLVQRWQHDELGDNGKPSLLSVEAAVNTICGWAEEAQVARKL